MMDGRLKQRVVYTIESLIDGSLVTAKGGVLGGGSGGGADRLTVVIRMKRPDAGLLFNMTTGCLGWCCGSERILTAPGGSPFVCERGTG
jgi:hypothetical protein